MAVHTSIDVRPDAKSEIPVAVKCPVILDYLASKVADIIITKKYVNYFFNLGNSYVESAISDMKEKKLGNWSVSVLRKSCEARIFYGVDLVENVGLLVLDIIGSVISTAATVSTWEYDETTAKEGATEYNKRIGRILIDFVGVICPFFAYLDRCKTTPVSGGLLPMIASNVVGLTPL